jgi:hypothetical protein
MGFSSVPGMPISLQSLPPAPNSPNPKCGLISIPGDGFVPLREASNGFISKTSMPCIFPKISNRSNPVACSKSVGTVATAAPGPMRSVSSLISVYLSAPSLPKAAPCSPKLRIDEFTLEFLYLSSIGAARGCCFSWRVVRLRSGMERGQTYGARKNS